MKKHVALSLCLLFSICSLASCDSEQTYTKTTPNNDYEKVLFAVNSVSEALKKPKLKSTSASKAEKALNTPLDAKTLVAPHLVNQAGITPFDHDTREDILELCFATDRTLQNAMDTKLVEYVKYFMEAIGESWDEDVVYSATISNTLGFDFDTFKKGSVKYPYDMDFLMQVQVAEDESVDIAVGFNVSLKSQPGKQGFTRYAKIKISSTYDVDSNDFTVDYNICSDYTTTPSQNSFIAYEREYIVVTKNTIESFDDYYAMTDQKIVLDQEHPNWQAYYDEGVRFFPGAKIFNGNMVYKIYTTGAGGKMTSVVHKDKLMELIVDGMGMHEGMNDTEFFASNTVETEALKTAEKKMSKKYGDPLVYDLLGNLDGINFDANNIDERPSGEEQQTSSQNTKAMRNIFVVLTPTLDLKGGPLSDIIVDKNTTLENLLLGRAPFRITNREEWGDYTLRLKVVYTDNSSKIVESLSEFSITISGEPVTDFSQKIFVDNEFGIAKRVDIIIEGNANNANAFIGVEFR